MRCGIVVVVGLLVAGDVCRPAEGAVKTWRYDWNLNTGRNWEGDSVGCGNSEAVLPSELDFGWTFVGRSSLSFASIVLPLSGGIIFGEGGSLMLGGSSPEANCPDAPNKIRWSHVGRDKWWDPLAWELPEELSTNASAVPDLHRVPCAADVAVVPDPELYLSPISFEPPMVSVSALTIAGKNYSTSEFMEYVSRNASTVITGFSSASDRALLYAEQNSDCVDGSDCLCHPGGGDVLQAVCSSRSGLCPEPPCLVPINMTGSCCPSCGTELTLPATYTGNRASLEALLGGLVNHEGARGVATYVGLMADRRYHVFVAAGESSADWAAVAGIVKTLLEQTLTADEARALAVTSSGASTDPRTAAVGSTVILVLVMLTVALLVAGLVYYGHKRGKLPQLAPSEARFRFRRMSMVAFRRMSRVSLHSDVLASRRSSDMSATTSATGTVPTYSAQTGGLRFMNPTFSKSTASLAAMPIDPEGGGGMGYGQDQPPPEGEEEGSLENPMYRAYMHMTPEEKKATDYTCQSGAATAPGHSPPKPPRLDDIAQGGVRFSQLCTIEEDLNTADDSSEVNNDEGTQASSQDGGANAGSASSERDGKGEDTKIVIEIPGEDSEQPQLGGDWKDEKVGVDEQNLVTTGFGDDFSGNCSSELKGTNTEVDVFGNTEGFDATGLALAPAGVGDLAGSDNFEDSSSFDPLAPTAPAPSDETASIDFGFE